MILENLLKSRELTSKIKEIKKEREEIWDIGIYGSAVRGKKEPNDIDFVIFLKQKMPFEKRNSISQGLREKVKDFIKNANVEVVSICTVYELMS